MHRMPLGPFGEVVGTTGTLDALGEDGQNYKSKVIAPRNPKVVRSDDQEKKKHMEKKVIIERAVKHPVLVKKPLLDPPMKPSKFLFDMRLTTEQKLANTHIMHIPRKVELLDMGDTSLQKFSQVSIDEPLFQPFPSTIYFQNFEPFETYEVPLSLRNNDKVPRLVKVTHLDSPYFKIISPFNVGHKVGPGLPTVFRIQFIPDMKKDYEHELICHTEREKFVVPVYAIGARAILDFPDEINFPVCPVKYPSTRTLLIRNIGQREAKFSLEAEKPFSVTPEIGTLGIDDIMQVTIEFNPQKTGDWHGDLTISYDTGEKVHVSLYGAAQDANVRLDKNSVRMENTYLSMASQRTVVIFNRSDFIAHFRWTQFATQEEEDQQKLLQRIELDREENTDTDRFLDECVTDPTLRDKISILSRTFQNRQRMLERDPMLFEDDVIKIEPVEGDIWPQSNFEVSVVFRPREALQYTRTAFCEITGRQSRLPLRIRGDGAGPKVEFSFEVLDMGIIFIGSKHSYEIVLANKGDIDAIYSVLPNSSLFGPCFSFNPAEGIVMPGGHQAIQIAFSSSHLGDFSEEFSFQVDGLPDNLKVTLKGSVIGPTFQFDVPKLKFGIVSYGFKHSKTCTLMNTSLVPMSFHLRVPGDGTTPSICATSDMESLGHTDQPTPRQGILGSVKEFDILPSTGTIPPQSEMKVTITLTSNQIRKYENVLVVDVDHVGEEILSLPISAKCIVPTVTLLTPVMDFERCFLGYPYEHYIRLYNDSDLAAKYIIIPEKELNMENPSILYESREAKGIIAPHSLCEVPLMIRAQMLEEQEVSCFVAIFGSQEPPMHVHVTCIGEGPVVQITPPKVDWGTIKVLVDNTKKLLLSNESLIPAKFTAQMLRPNSVFSVYPQDGEIPPESDLEITVTAHLNDCVRFNDKLKLTFIESLSRLVPLCAYGQGTTITSDPPLLPLMDLGPSYSNRPLRKVFRLTNSGRRHQQLTWMTEGFGNSYSRKKHNRRNLPPITQSKKKDKTFQMEELGPVFEVMPSRFELKPGESIDFTLEGFVNEPQSVKEQLSCHAILGRTGGKELIMKIDVSAEFISPLLEFSTKSVFFRVDKSVKDTLEILTRSLEISNMSSLPLTILLTLNYPFSILLSTGETVQEMETCLECQQKQLLTIQFDPAYKEDLHIRIIDEVLHVAYKEHPHIDYVSLRGEVYFPNLEFEKTTLHFGCILNDTEVTRYVNITNNSPMQVKYKWSYLVGNVPTKVKRIARPRPLLIKKESVRAIEEEIEALQSTFDEEEEESGDSFRIKLEEEGEEDNQTSYESLRKQTFDERKLSLLREGSDEDEYTDDNKEGEESENSDDSDESQKNEMPLAVPEDIDTPEKGQLEQSQAEKDEDQLIMERLLLGSRLSLRVEEEEALRSNCILSALLEQEVEETPLASVEEVFDILPLYGILEPGETEQVTFTFFGHADIWGEVKAVCEVEGGPTYELTITGEAGQVEYHFDHKEINFGKQMYDTVAVAELVLINSGKVAFEYRALNMDPSMQSRPKPGCPILVPASGKIGPFGEQKLEVHFLPGVPECFHKTFAIQVAHFEPDVISISGEGVFPRVSLDLPRYTDAEGYYDSLAKEARANLCTKDLLTGSKSLHDLEEFFPCSSTDRIQSNSEFVSMPPQNAPTELEIQMEIERLAVRDFALQMQIMTLPQSLPPFDLHPPDLNNNPNFSASARTMSTMPTPPAEESGEFSQSHHLRRKRLRPKLPEYLLDFGYVVLGTQQTHVVRATNTGWFPVSFKIERGNIHSMGFIVELDRVRNLPGAPDNETVDFVVTFDPRAANLQLGPVETVVFINIVNGPQVGLRLRGIVTMPDMEVSDDVLEFQEVKCGECKVITVQFHNHQQVRCDWFSGLEEEYKAKLEQERRMHEHSQRFVPLYLRRKLRQEKKKPPHFEVLPASGSLMPGQRVNVQIKFMPTEEIFYEQRIPIRIAQSSQRLLLLCRGQGLEPRLEFDHQLVEFGPILPHSNGVEQEVVICNPCNFPIEFYSLEFDQQYLEEEKVLRLMRGYDEYSTILLPPRVPSEKLPNELLDFYDEQMKKLEEEERAKEEAKAEELQRQLEEKEEDALDDKVKQESEDIKTEQLPSVLTTTASATSGSIKETVQAAVSIDEAERKEERLEERIQESANGSLGVGELEITPISMAIARYLGIDLSAEGKAARNRRGLAIILHGAPMTGKSTVAIALARHYNAAMLTLDGVIMDAIASGNTSAGMRARQLCAEAAHRKAEEVRLQESEESEKKPAGLSVEAVTVHTQGGANPSVISSIGTVRKTSQLDTKSKEKGVKTLNTSSGEASSQIPSTPPLLTVPQPQRLSVSTNIAGEDGLLSCVFPEELLIEILSERLQLNDCHRGVIFDGLETLFSQNYFSTLNAILKALNNRRFIYFCTLKMDFSVLKEHEQLKKLKIEEEQKRKEEEELLRLEEMDEEEYDALSDSEKARTDEKRLVIKKARIKKEQEERAERERREKEAREEEERRREEEAKLKKSKKGKGGPPDPKEKDKKGAPQDKKGAPPATDRGQKSQGGARHDTDHKVPAPTDRPESHGTEKSDGHDDGKKKKKAGKDGKKEKGGHLNQGDSMVSEEHKDNMNEEEILLMQRFRKFEVAQKDIADFLELWDRTTLQVQIPHSPSEPSEEEAKEPPQSAKKGKSKDKHEKEKEKLRQQQEKEMAEKAAKEAAAAAQGSGKDKPAKAKEEESLGIPHIVIDCSDHNTDPMEKLLSSRFLPSLEEVLDGLGMGPRGPPIPPPAVFAVVPYPVKRRAPLMAELGGRYIFVASSPDDPNVIVEEKTKDPDAEEEKSATPEKIGKEDHAARGKVKGAEKKATSGDPTTKERKRSADRKSRMARRNSAQISSPPPGATTPVSDGDNQSTTGEGLAPTEPKTAKLSTFRWIVPANGEIMIRLRFQSEELGQFDQTFNFEIVSTRRRYQLFCRGVCAFPTISKEPRIVFPSRKKNMKPDEIVNKKYILMNETFEFGPLLVGKSRERYKEGRYPENMESFKIFNSSPMEAEVSFCFFTDSKGETFLLDPPSGTLKPNDSMALTVWAYPKGPGRFEDAVVVCIRDNPEPVVFKVACDGFRPELELDKKVLHFDKVLLHRKDTKVLYLRNSTKLPVAWRLSGLEMLGEDFTVGADTGVVQPLSEYPLQAYFRAMRPVQTSKRMIRLEISDADNIMGVVSTEPIQVIAEAYDVALDMSFPKGTDGGLDFGTMRVNEERKEVCTLKNKGKYDIAYSFVLENVDPGCPDLASFFSVIPTKGTLTPVDRPTQVQVIFKSPREVIVRDQPVLKCLVIEPNLNEGGEVIANIPVKISVKAVYTKFNIQPSSDVNFGCLLVNSKKTRTFTIENKGEFEFRYTITKYMKEAVSQTNVRQQRPVVKGEKRDGSSSGRSVARPKKADSLRQEQGGQSRLMLGMFTIFPAFGMITPNNQQVITVDCVAETQAHAEEELSIDITDRNPKAYPSGILYKLIAEACIPSINTDDIGSIFEEHRICKSLNAWHNSTDEGIGGVYVELEKRFIFNSVIVGCKAKARFKIHNPTKVPCDLLFSLKPLSSQKTASKTQEAFEVDPQRASMPSHGFLYVTISFSPQSMQSYFAVFEAAIEGITPNQPRGKPLTFEIAGEGNLPRVTVVKPMIRSKHGQPLLLFKKILVGRTQILPFELLNEGTLPCKVNIDLLDPDGVFVLQSTSNTQNVAGDMIDDLHRRPHTVSISINMQEVATFTVTFRPTQAQRSVAHIRMSVVDNQYEDSVVQLVGEGYQDDITLDNITSVFKENTLPEDLEGNMADVNVAAARPNLMVFGNCYINEPRTLSLTMTNHSKTDCIRFSWPDHPHLRFCPQVGHLHAGCSKDVSVTFCTNTPKTMVEEVVAARVVKITFEKPAEQVSDWDDRIRTVKWVDIPPVSSQVPDNTVNKFPSATLQTGRGLKKKVVETEPEPACTEVVESARNVELLVSVVCDYSKYTCDCESVCFRNTLMFQTRMYEVLLNNVGEVAMDYSWQIVMENSTFQSLQRSVTFISEGDRSESRADMMGSSDLPFSIDPQFGTIPAGKKASCIIKFSPLDVNEYEGRLICSIPNLENNIQGPVIGVKGRSMMPFCHFELIDSDYLSGARRDLSLLDSGIAPRISLDPNTRVIEFEVVGIGLHSVKEFCIVNPTSSKYNFEWLCEDETDNKASPCFRCLTPRGEICSGRKSKVGFEFVSNTLDIVESLWCFVIPEQNITVPFLLVGHTREPNVILDRSHLSFKALLIGSEAVETVNLINHETIPYSFQFLEESCHTEGFGAHLRVEPMSGQIPPKSRLAINLSFAPNSEKVVNFNLVCKVQRRLKPITLNVKAEGYTMNCIVLCEDSAGNRIQLTSRGTNQIHFGDVEINETAIRQLHIINSGKFNFDYTWSLNKSALHSNMIAINPVSGSVTSKETEKCLLSFCPPTRTILRRCELMLGISKGPSFTISVMGQGVTPGLHFSFHSYNFGNAFVHHAGMPALTTVLKLTNKDKKDVSVECQYEATPQLHHSFEAKVIPCGESIDIPFTFYPREARRYQELVNFEINGLSKQTVEFVGNGCEMKVEVSDPRNKVVNLGSRYFGDVVKKYIPIVNNSPAPISFHLAFTPYSVRLQSPDILSVGPVGRLTLDPRGGSMRVEVIFKPNVRIPAFAEEVLMESEGISLPLFVLKGSCLGMEVTLDTDAIPFGTVCYQSSVTRTLVMSNTGDMNTRFRWDSDRFLPDFSISPVEGYITPGTEVTFDVNFHPQTISSDIRCEKLRCFLDGGPHKPITLTLTGSCTAIVPSKEVQNFMTFVRGKETKMISIINKTNQLWELSPVIEGEFWSGPIKFIVEPQQTKQYELTYRPLTMTTESKKHMGTLFFPLPDGTGLLFNLQGTADVPKPNGKISREVPCKTTYTELLTVYNWLNKAQRFRVKTEPIKPEKFDPGTTVKGMEYVDVPPSSSKDYKLNFYAYRETAMLLKVTFINDQTGEYQYYEISIRATKPGVIAMLELSTPVRKSVPYTLRLDNPLNTPITFSATCNVPEIQMPSQLQVPPQSQGLITFEYQPLKIGDVQGKLEFNNSELGLFMYDLLLHATHPIPEKIVYFRTSLGQSFQQPAKFLNYAKQKTDYICKVDNADFHVEKTVAAAPASTDGTEVALEVTFEPSRLGEQRATLIVSSPIGGEYTFPLVGTCTPPKPQGPYIIKAGATSAINFRNVFSNTTTFLFQVDNPLFYVTKNSESIRSKKEQRIVVGFDGGDATSKAPVMGRLVVSCTYSAGGNSSTQWVYYLKGVKH
ncbi:hydrocephalus-inducing protein-like isoform X4 [Pomacea canaliculata]|uniref:hydrocephalus-inducing protein-like isoform X4 n=1 Tax=Pomacea canaliculata TaxID=400727 RepID=UPI000D73E2C9|nr:hydrocephalus-inducing protein-like isoform X4 [Pomacea canaliculata]